MELRQLTTFRTVAMALSFTRAATILDYAQSSVTAQIQALEEDLGVRLFDRLGKHVALTDAGQRLLHYAEKMLNLSAEARMVVSGAEALEVVGSVTISAPETLCTYRLPVVLRHFRANYPQVQLAFRPMAVADMRRSVSDGLIDVAFVLEESFQSHTLCTVPLVQEPIVVIAAPDHPLAALPSVLPIALENETLLLTETGCSYRNRFMHTLTAAGVQPNTMLEFNSVEAIKQCVMVGMGISVLPEVAVAAEIAGGRLVALPWVGGDLAVVTHMMWHKDKWISPALRTFLQEATEMLAAIPA